ncbi:LPS translocon maturation chaperone LptM [Ciceribacter azotifigens]|uniref:LPS translocon maturation chaperone LptM n=1 Tax=Ciceribacter azotifigens TaxID=2069303 RepID=UPI003A8515AD
MARALRSLFVTMGVMAAASVALSGCGRKADLDPPNMPAAEQNKQSTKQEATVPDDPFVLDPLL